MHKRGYSRHAVFVRPSVRLSVTFVDHVKTNKGIDMVIRILRPTVLYHRHV